MNLNNPFRTLKHRNFRLLWTGEVLRTSSQWMDTITRGFLIYELTGSDAQLALVNAARSAPLIVVGLVAGVLADRMSRKKLLMSSQTLNVVSHAAIAVLAFTGLVELWQVYVTVVVVGFGMGINVPARQSMIPTLVPDDDLQSAVVLNTATLNIGMAVGPAIGGFLVGLAGIPAAFAVQALMVGAAGLLISRIEVGEPPPRTGARASWWSSAVDGLRYVGRHRLLLPLFVISLVPAILAQPFRGVVPAITVTQLMADATLTGLLMSALGIGALVSVLALASLPPSRHPWLQIVISACVLGVGVAGFALSTNLALSALALFVVGVTQANNRTLTQSLLLAETEDSYRGRVSSLWVVNRGTLPLGSLLLAALTTSWGVTIAVAAMGVATTVLTVLMWARWRDVETRE